MPVNVVMPQMGESVTEGTVVRWIRKIGDAVDRDEPLFEISTDKVDAEIPSPAAGTLAAIHVKEGETVPVDALVAVIAQAGEAANGSYHLVFFTPWFPEAVKNPDIAVKFVGLWNAKGHNVGGLTEGFRGWDGLHTIVAAIAAAGKAEPEAIRAAMWNVKVKGINGDIAFIKQGPAGRESAQNVPSVYLVKIENGKVVKP